MSQVKHFLVFIITPAIPHGAFKMKVTFCVKAVYMPVLDKRVPVIAGSRQQPRFPGGSPVARPRKELRPAPTRRGGRSFVCSVAGAAGRQPTFRAFVPGSLNSQYPALNMRCFALSRRESGSQETRKCTVKVRAGHPFRSGKCVMLMIVPILPRDWSRCLPVSGSRAVRCKSSSAPFARTTAVTRCDFPHLCLGDLLPEPGFFVPSSAILVPGNRAKM